MICCIYFDNTKTVIVTVGITIVKTFKFFSDISASRLYVCTVKYENTSVFKFLLKKKENLLKIMKICMKYTKS